MPEDNLPSTLTNFADLMDSRFKVPGTNIRYGLDAVIGLIPGIGDWIGGLAALYFPLHAAAIQLPAPVILRMFINIIADLAIGSIPLLGDLFDFSWKANVKNAGLLQKYQNDPQTTRKRSRLLVWSLVALFVLIIILILFLISWLIAALFEFLF